MSFNMIPVLTVLNVRGILLYKVSTIINNYSLVLLTELPVFPGSSKFGASSLSRRHSWAYIELYFGSSRAFSKT